MRRIPDGPLWACGVPRARWVPLLLLLVVIPHSLGSRAEKDLSRMLHHYSLLSLGELTHSVSRRALGAPASLERYLTFSALDRDFRLLLIPNGVLFTPTFRAELWGVGGRVRSIPVDTHSFYSGSVLGEQGSRVQAHLDHDDFTARIISQGQEYHVEPLWRLTNGTAADGRLVVYRSVDVRPPAGPLSAGAAPPPHRFCGITSPGGPAAGGGGGPPRARRSPDPAAPRDTCKLLLVADFRFFTHMGRSQESSTVNYLIELIDRVDDIYRITTWDNNNYRGYGLQIDQIIVHQKPTAVSSSKRHYNMNGTSPPGAAAWNVKALLEQFSIDVSESARNVCLAHLFTYQDFSQGTLGLAYVGSPKPNAVGGICTPSYFNEQAKKYIFLNTGLTSTMNYGKTILTKEADLVTTHEFGHNFGAEHDPDSAECSAPDEAGGKFVMYPYAVSGDHENNKMFSNCSKRAIHKTLEAKASRCFFPRTVKLCGNSRVEEGEQCDAGPAFAHIDACCTDTCKLRPGKLCSDRNSPCCRNCTYEQAGKLCQEPIPSICRSASFCTGVSSECPPAGPADDNSTCVDSGKCDGGQCKPFCETVGLQSCACKEVDLACSVCCRVTPDGPCVLYEQDGGRKRLRKGKTCSVGFCDGNGKCEKTVQDPIERFWVFIDKLDINSFRKFLADNIVGSVLVFSLICWVPLSILVHCVDKKLDRQFEESKVMHFLPASTAELNSSDSAPFRVVRRNCIQTPQSRAPGAPYYGYGGGGAPHHPHGYGGPPPQARPPLQLSPAEMQTIPEDPGAEGSQGSQTEGTRARSYEDLTDGGDPRGGSRGGAHRGSHGGAHRGSHGGAMVGRCDSSDRETKC
uniref:Disintegrin and metalloproteinase domain-containing protein 17 n=1 Tax=Petromyzon marinus TaxID=7757 RepID=A0AAJ7X9C1_PETMA|nr:disintegrin and metalloproteinase domain-containing protein 17 [Petromyzon marinus]